MSGRRVRAVAETAQTVIAFAAGAINSDLYRRILPAFAALLVVAAVPILFRVDMPSVAASSILKCYDSAGNYEPCAAQASASLSEFNGRTAQAHQPAALATIALNKQDLITIAVNQQESSTTTTVDQPPDWKTSAPVARRSNMPRRRQAFGRCSIRCFFSALRKKVTHFASVAATEAGSIPAREPREGYRSKNL